MIPHRPPILCIDTIVSAEPEAVTCTYKVRDAGICPDAPNEYWEPGLIEGIAQTAAVMNGRDAIASGRQAHSAGQTAGQTAEQKGMLVAVRKFSVKRRARRGETITYRAELIRRITPLSLVHGTARVGEEVIAEGEFKFYVHDGESK